MDDFTDNFTEPQRHKNGCGYIWTKADDQQLASLWPHNTAGNIAKIMLPPRSRNAIIGRAHRIGLGMKLTRVNKGAVAPRKRTRRKPPGLSTITKQPKVEIAIDPQGWTPIGVPLLEAERQHCRAIIEQTPTAVPGNAICCGHHVTHPVFSFCPYHLELYTESAHGRRRSHWRHWKHARR